MKPPRSVAAVLALLLAPCLSAPARAKDHEMHLYVEPEGSLAFGEQDEFVFWDESKNSDGLVSKLEWQERNVKLYGGKAGFSFERLGGELQILSAAKGESGEMYDSDYLNYDSMKTHYSVNKNTLESGFMLSVLASFDFHPIRSYGRFSLAPTAEFAYKNLLFSSENKEGWYGALSDGGSYSAWNASDAVHYPNDQGTLCGIEYKKVTFSAFLGARAKLDLLDGRLHLMLGAAAAPYVYASAEDKHFLDLSQKSFEHYKDYADIIFRTFKGNFSTFFDINDIISLGLNGDGLLSLATKGLMSKYDKPDGTWKTYDGYWSGCSEYSFQIGAGIRINIF